MRARERDDVPAGAAAARCVRAGLVGIGDALRRVPATLPASQATASLWAPG